MTQVRALLILTTLGVLLLFPMLVQAQTESPPITYERYDVDITVNTDGTFRVREIQRIRFDESFRSAFAEIPLAYTSNITDVVVLANGSAYEKSTFGGYAGSYTWRRNGSNIDVEWNYNRTAPGDVKTFVLEYTVEGGLWVYDEEYVLEWRAVPGDRSGFTAESSTVTVHIPTTPAADALHYTAFGPAYTATAQPGQVTFTATKALPDGMNFQVMVGFPKAGITAEKQPFQIEEKEGQLLYRFARMDVDLFVGKDGVVTVEEQQRISVTQGLLGQGERVIPLAYTDGVTNVQVFEGEEALRQAVSLCDYCYTVSEQNRRPDWIRYDEVSDRIRIYESEAGKTVVQWQVPPLVSGEATTFRVRYDVPGLIVGDTTGQRFDWTAIFDRHTPTQGEDDRVLLQSAPGIEAATVRLHLPEGVSPDSVTMEGGTLDPQPDGTLLLTYDGAVPAGTAWEVTVTLPPNATTGATPQWVQALAAAQQAQQEAAARLAQQQLGLGAGSILTLVGGLIGTFLLWFTRGRDAQVPLQADYLSEPPSGLPPGIVAYLVDEKPTTKGALAALFHLATLGFLTIDFEYGFYVRRNWADTELSDNQEVTLENGETVTVPPHLVRLYNAIAIDIPTDSRKSFTALNARYAGALPGVYEQMGYEASTFFSELPTKSRLRWVQIGQGLILVGLLLTAGAYFWGRETWGDVVLWIPVALAIVGAALLLLSNWMAQKTSLGAEEASKWEAFKRYLQNLQKYGNVAEAQQVLDDYFPYAVALDVEEVVIKEASALGTHAPVWTQPATVTRTEPFDSTHPRMDTTHRSAPIRVLPRPTLPSVASPEKKSTDWSAQSVSNDVARSITSADKGLATLLNTAGGAREGATPFQLVQSGAKGIANVGMDVGKTTFEILGEILESSSSGGGNGGYSGGSSSRSSGRSSSWGRSSSSSSSRSSSSRRSGGGGSRGFR